MTTEAPIAAVRVTVDSLVARGPALLWGCAVNPSAAWAVQLRDGQNASAPVVIEIGDQGATAGIGMFTRPVLFHNGIFADLGAGLTSVTIFYEPVHEEGLEISGGNLDDEAGPDD